ATAGQSDRSGRGHRAARHRSGRASDERLDGNVALGGHVDGLLGREVQQPPAAHQLVVLRLRRIAARLENRQDLGISVDDVVEVADRYVRVRRGDRVLADVLVDLARLAGVAAEQVVDQVYSIARIDTRRIGQGSDQRLGAVEIEHGGGMDDAAVVDPGLDRVAHQVLGDGSRARQRHTDEAARDRDRRGNRVDRHGRRIGGMDVDVAAERPDPVVDAADEGPYRVRDLVGGDGHAQGYRHTDEAEARGNGSGAGIGRDGGVVAGVEVHRADGDAGGLVVAVAGDRRLDVGVDAVLGADAGPADAHADRAGADGDRAGQHRRVHLLVRIGGGAQGAAGGDRGILDGCRDLRRL